MYVFDGKLYEYYMIASIHIPLDPAKAQVSISMMVIKEILQINHMDIMKQSDINLPR